MNDLHSRSIAAALIIALGLAVAGGAIGLGFFYSRNTDRYVTVKGLAEREVNADLAIWPITFRVSDNNLNSLQAKIDTDRKIITEFLRTSGFNANDISYAAPKITDTRTEQRYSGGNAPEERYLANTTVTVRSTDVPLVKNSMEDTVGLVGSGVMIAAENWQTPTEFLYTNLNDIKPNMIETATINARKAAEKFAQDSGSRVGKIRKATQGYFSISDRDRNSPDKKVVRVVTTVEYFLID